MYFKRPLDVDPSTSIIMMRSATNAGMALSAALLLMLLVNPIQAHLPHQAGRRMTASVLARSSAVATDGASVNAVSQAASTGSPASSVVNAQGSGQGTVIDCRQQAKDNESLYKECIEKNGAGGGSGTGGTTVSWENAPRCTKPASAYAVKRDEQQKPWGWENNSSCALRDEQGNATA
ncbi:hypothetical protein COO60DRAFT_757887 [Scenedesmus sp. NREL 46B-D3]|nr:hypothetical protein COO60DRAFT_757887 [Scenedesmus sp. NREL 46B-D3]